MDPHTVVEPDVTGDSSPMLEQYWKLKEQYPDTLLLFRMGDFYEMFFDDAKVGSRLLGVTLTSRNHGKTQHVPLAGIPWHALDNYLPKLIRAGKRVAICEQMEDSKTSGKLVRRDVVEVVTPGTILSEPLLEQKMNNYLVAVSEGEVKSGVAAVDLSTGEFRVEETPTAGLLDEIERIGPSELVGDPNWLKRRRSVLEGRFPGLLLTEMDAWVFTRRVAHELLTSHFGVSSLVGFDCEELDEGMSAAGAALRYLKNNQKAALEHITRISRRRPSDTLILDPSTQRNLEITRSLRDGSKEGTLLGVVDCTDTPMGGRLLRNWLQNPLRDVPAINQRLDAVEELAGNGGARKELTGYLTGIGDIERVIAKVCCGRATPRDLVGLRTSLECVPRIIDCISRLTAPALRQAAEVPDVRAVSSLIRDSIVDNPPLAVTEGGIIREGYDAELDGLRVLVAQARGWIARLQTTERARTGIPSLKVAFNRAFGYYIEITNAHLAKAPPDYTPRQTMVGATRFVTQELKEWEARILGADDRMREIEKELFVRTRTSVAEHAADIQAVAAGIAVTDALLAFAESASSYGYVRPTVDQDDAVVIKSGRHPVVERLLREGEFVPNDLECNRGSDQILIITGPNMAGKSTYLRQVGLIVLMAQAGSFVPAAHAKIGVVDRIFTRVGASDNLARGESTFLVEMNEAANILNNATDSSLVLLDEVGRGTSTFDGLSIAWAVTEYLHNGGRQPKTLFATHYPELTDLAEQLPRVKNFNVAVREKGDQIIFLRKIVPGGADRSYGIQVARLAGLPAEVIERATEILRVLEKQDEVFGKVSARRPRQGRRMPMDDPQLGLFDQLLASRAGSGESPVLQEIRNTEVSTLTPLQALVKINEWKTQLETQ